MSLLKKTFEEICSRNMTAAQDMLTQVMGIKDIVNITVEYLIDEEEFETEILLLCYWTDRIFRVERLLMNCKNENVRRWFVNVRRMLSSYYKDGSLEFNLTTALILQGNCCNRIWCWYHQKRGELHHDRNDDCICRRPLTNDFVHSSLAKNIYFSRFPQEIFR